MSPVEYSNLVTYRHSPVCCRDGGGGTCSARSCHAFRLAMVMNAVVDCFVVRFRVMKNAVVLGLLITILFLSFAVRFKVILRNVIVLVLLM